MVNTYELVDWFTKASVVPGIFFNLLLIFLVRKYSRKDIGTFSNLLIVFAAYDINLIVLHTIFDPKSFTLPGYFISVLDFGYGSRFLTCLHFICFMASYAILITHLLYRYWVIRKPYNIELFSSPVFVFKLVASVAAMGTLLILLSFSVIETEDSKATEMIKEKFHQRFNRTIDRGWVIAEYWPNNEWNIPAILVALAFDTVGGSIVIVVITLATLTYRHISTAFTLSPSTRSAQMQLLKTVCVQTFIPLVCVMTPYFVNLTLPIVGITIPALTQITGTIMSFFPTWDPLAVIMLMRPYRMGLRSMICGAKRVEKPKGSTVTSIALVSGDNK